VSQQQTQIDKLAQADKLVLEAASSPDIVKRLGAVVLLAGMVDFAAIQAARLIEQIVLKGQLSEGKEPTFRPSEDSFFYSSKVSTRRIFKVIHKVLPFRGKSEPHAKDAEKINKLGSAMLQAGHAFLDCRDPLLHQIGNPARTFDEVMALVDTTIGCYHKFIAVHREFFEVAAPYRFGPAELARFYGEHPPARPA
jgi:hypothetical protein